ncbi:MAG: PAS domain-containing protein [Betaproteobacteria bacterium]|nr:PAS domain-containing protein [Betaproteobacteria bacterium]
MNDGGWQALLEGVIEAVWLVDPIGLRIVAANRAAAQMLGIRPGELIGKPAIELAATPEDHFFWEDVASRAGSRNFFRCPVAAQGRRHDSRRTACRAGTGAPARGIAGDWSPPPTASRPPIPVGRFVATTRASPSCGIFRSN